MDVGEEMGETIVQLLEAGGATSAKVPKDKLPPKKRNEHARAGASTHAVLADQD